MTVARITKSAADAAGILLAGGIVAIPTETVYGLAAVATDHDAVARVYAAKGRPGDHPLIVHVDSMDMARRYGDVNDTAAALAEAFWPGPLTLLLERTPLAGDHITGGRDTVAVRMPSHALALEIIGLCGEGLVAPSANVFGHVSPTTARHVLDDLGERIDAVVDGGPCEVGVESTIVDCAGDLQILRPGAVSRAEVEECLGRKVSRTTGPSRAPGMLASHYAPRATVRLVASVDDADELESALRTSGHSVVVIGRNTDARSYAADLYVLLRRADDQNVDDIIAIEPPGDDLAVAVRDRLSRAAADTRS